MELPFEEAMLKWPAGPKPFDGPWANWWYSTTHRCVARITSAVLTRVVILAPGLMGSVCFGRAQVNTV
jgi:hypothetical protein